MKVLPLEAIYEKIGLLIIITFLLSPNAKYHEMKKNDISNNSEY
jgi:hypothetical protein